LVRPLQVVGITNAISSARSSANPINPIFNRENSDMIERISRISHVINVEIIRPHQMNALIGGISDGSL
jgi:hypothetical protein